MKQAITAFAVSLGLCAAPAFADQTRLPAKTAQAVKMSDAELDNVAAGALISGGLITVQIGDVRIPVQVLNNSVNGNTVQIPVAATVSAAVAALGNASSLAQQFGASATH
jgi:hydroxymethylglutaryl-CoA reductase